RDVYIVRVWCCKCISSSSRYCRQSRELETLKTTRGGPDSKERSTRGGFYSAWHSASLPDSIRDSWNSCVEAQQACWKKEVRPDAKPETTPNIEGPLHVVYARK